MKAQERTDINYIKLLLESLNTKRFIFLIFCDSMSFEQQLLSLFNQKIHQGADFGWPLCEQHRDKNPEMAGTKVRVLALSVHLQDVYERKYTDT